MMSSTLYVTITGDPKPQSISRQIEELRMLTKPSTRFQSLCRPTCFGLIAMMLLVAPVSLFAQVDKGVINGTVSDSTRAVISDVRVVATNIETGVTYSGTSNTAGIYQIQGLPIGQYSLRFEKA